MAHSEINMTETAATAAYADLAATLDAAWEDRASVSQETKGKVRDAVEAALDLLDGGKARVAEKIDGEWVQRLRIHYNCVGEMNIPNEPALPIPAVTVNTRKGVFVSYTTDDRPAV